jgi:hypothetical protein
LIETRKPPKNFELTIAAEKALAATQDAPPSRGSKTSRKASNEAIFQKLDERSKYLDRCNPVTVNGAESG